MSLPTTLQGRPFGPAELAQIHALLREQPTWSRYQLSRELARRWQWRTAAGLLKDMAARTLLLKLEQRGCLQLPPKRCASPTRSGRVVPPDAALQLAETPVTGALARLGPVVLTEVSRPGHHASRAVLEECLRRHHYLGYRSRVGQNLQYWVHSVQGQPLACVVFGAAAWQCAARDQWLGWTAAQRAQHLGRVANNTRFLLLPWVRVPQLASHILSRLSRRLAADWLAKYRQPVVLLETFVDGARFAGTCYQAANWRHLGQTTGRGRQRPGPATVAPSIKQVYVLPLRPNFRHQLTAPTANANPNRL